MLILKVTCRLIKASIHIQRHSVVTKYRETVQNLTIKAEVYTGI